MIELCIFGGGKYLKAGWISPSDYDDLYKYLYLPYKKNGGNGSAERLMEQIKELPPYPPIKIQKGEEKMVQKIKQVKESIVKYKEYIVSLISGILAVLVAMSNLTSDKKIGLIIGILIIFFTVVQAFIKTGLSAQNLQLAYNQLLTIRDMLAAAETNTVSMKFSPKLLSTGDETDNQSEAVVPESSTIRDTFTDDELMKRLIGKKE